MNNLEKRIERLENSRQVSEGQVVQVDTFIFTSTEGPHPTDEEIKEAKKKFLEEHPGHQGIIILSPSPITTKSPRQSYIPRPYYYNFFSHDNKPFSAIR